MATLDDIYTIATGSNPTSPSLLFKKVMGGVVSVAREIYDEDPSVPEHGTRIFWAKTALAGPESMAGTMIWRVVTDHAGLPAAQINALDDTAVLNSIRNAVTNWVNSL